MRPVRVLAIAAQCLFLLCVGADVHAATYEWLDEYGVLIRSETLPLPGTPFRELRVVAGTESLTPLERRTLEIINDEARASYSPPNAAGAPQFSVEPAAGDNERFVSVEPSAVTENTRDPCLLSWDATCHAKHAADYDPRWGYAPSLLRTRREETSPAPPAPPLR